MAAIPHLPPRPLLKEREPLPLTERRDGPLRALCRPVPVRSAKINQRKVLFFLLK